MAVALRYRAEAPGCNDAAKKDMPKGPGVHIAVDRRDFGGRAAEKGRWLFHKGRQTPLPSPDREEDKRPTYAPAPNEPRGLRRAQLIELTKSDVDSDDLPTFGPAKKTTPTPAPQMAKEEKMLHPESMAARTTNSFAPPPPVSIPDIGKILKFEQKGTVHKIIAKYRRKKPEPPKENERPSISPKDGSWLLVESPSF